MLGYVYGECSGSETVGASYFLRMTCINPRSFILGPLDSSIRSLKTSQDLTLKVATPVGIVLGQIFFGWSADRLGRKKMCTSTAAFFCVDWG